MDRIVINPAIMGGGAVTFPASRPPPTMVTGIRVPRSRSVADTAAAPLGQDVRDCRAYAAAQDRR